MAPTMERVDAALSAPPTLRTEEMVEEPKTARLVVVAEVRRVLPVSVVEAKVAEEVALRTPMVEVEMSAPALRVRTVVVAFEGNGYPMVLVIVTAPVEPESEIPEPATLEVTPVLVMEGATEPTTVKEEQEIPEVQEAEEVAME